MSDLVKFVWAGTSYTIPEGTMARRILLPTGVVLEFNGFSESFPPQLNELHAAVYTISIHPMPDMEYVARQLQAVLATELGYCPDHPEEHGKFCSECGKPIHPPTPLAPKPPFPFQGSSTIPEPFSKHDFHLTVPADVMGNGPCPNCKTSLDHNHQFSSCPNCGQALHWTCR